MSSRSHILIVEDHRGIVDALRLVLEEEGYKVEVWTHEAMIRPLSDPLPDLILLDLLLGGMDGKTLCQQFKQTPATRHIPVILMSANKHIARIAAEVGADAWLLKPFAVEAILTHLEEYLGQKSRSGEEEPLLQSDEESRAEGTVPERGSWVKSRDESNR